MTTGRWTTMGLFVVNVACMVNAASVTNTARLMRTVTAMSAAGVAGTTRVMMTAAAALLLGACRSGGDESSNPSGSADPAAAKQRERATDAAAGRADSRADAPADSAGHAAGDGRAEPGSDAAAGKKAGTPADDDGHDGEANVVHVDPGMLRDLRVTTGVVESRRGGEEVTLLGELAVDERAYAEVGVPVAARVRRLMAGAGDTVRAGQPLAELTSPDLARSRADFHSARARVALADAVLQRKRELAAERIAPLREVQEAEREAAEAQASLRAARATLGIFDVEPPADEGVGAGPASSSFFVLRAPVSGSVIERAAVVGQLLDPSKPAFLVGNLSTLWLTVHAFERDAVRLTSGVRARLAFAALPNQDFDGTITVVGRRVDRESRTVPVRIDVRNTSGLLRPGMSASAAVPIGTSGARILTVAVAAVQRVRDAWCVFLPRDEAGTFEIRRIGRGRDLGREVEVLSGLRAGDSIVVDGAFLLKAHAEKGEGGHDDH